MNHPLFFIDYVKLNGSYIMPHAHNHNIYELYILEQGNHSILINDSIYQLANHDVVLLKPNIFHKSLQKQDYARTCIYFTERFLRLHFTEYSIHQLLDCFNQEIISIGIDTFPRVKRLMTLLAEENVDSFPNRIFIYLAELLTILNVEKNNPQKRALVPTYTDLAPILAYINENYNGITNIDEISDRFYISKYYLCRKFKEVTGLTLIQYITNIKLQNASYMLLNTNMSISKIGSNCGFNSTMYFCKIFKLNKGMTPSEFRKSL